MNRPDFLPADLLSSTGPVSEDQAHFSSLYDQYATKLLGIISTIVHDKTEAVRLLEITFTKIRSQLGQPRPAGQPVFIWLLTVARSTALEANQKAPKSARPAPLLSADGKVITGSVNTSDVKESKSVSFAGKDLIDAVLFQNCTPEEAVTKLGLPQEAARQQLRLAMQQLRTAQVTR